MSAHVLLMHLFNGLRKRDFIVFCVFIRNELNRFNNTSAQILVT